MLRGIGTSKGIGIGKALIILTGDVKACRDSIEDVDAEKKRFYSAKEKFIQETEQLIEALCKKLGEQDKNALILKNQIYIINDITLEDEVLSLIEKKNNAEMAVYEACDKLIDIFSAINSEEMRQRVQDILDLRTRMLQLLKGVERIDLTKLPENTILVAKEIHPSMTAAMDSEHVVGIVAEKGGETSHASILARALEIPAVLSVKDVTQKVKTGDEIIVDGAYGEVFVNPTDRTRIIYSKKKDKYEELKVALREYVDKETATADNVRVKLFSNIGGAEEAKKVVLSGSEGVGLFRTEFLFMNGISLPKEDEQFEQYKKAAVLLKGRTLTIRTLDIGGDKDIPYLGLSRENNPFLGYRAIRFCLGRVDIFTTQLRAILRASAYGNIRILIPLITSVDELRQVKSLISRICRDLDKKEIKYDKNIKVGVMIETPAAALIADVLAKEADFFSIGTNDLIQYTVAVDRCNENVSYLYTPMHPSVLRLIKSVIDAGHKEQIEVGMCGEAAGNDLIIPLLLGMGLDEFSVSNSRVLETRKNIAEWSFSEALELANNALTLPTEKEISNYLNDNIRSRMLNMGVEKEKGK